MLNKRGFTAERNRNLLSRLFINACADEGEPTSEPSSTGINSVSTSTSIPTNTINYEELIAHARKEEKDKLYPRMKKLEDDNKALTEKHNQTLIELGTARQRIAELEASGESEEVAKLKKDLADSQAEVGRLKASAPNEEAIRKEIEAEYEVKLYTQKKVSEGSDSILPIFAGDVQGKTKEEVDAAFEAAVNKTIETKKQLGLLDADGNPVDLKKSSTKKKSPEGTPSAPPVANPSTKGDEGFDFEYVQNLDPRSPEYAEFRKKMGLR